ncbi:MAG: DNA (cytosine-5-)-methyltransferase [Christensenellaceae bacterium]|jgi:DNA (cytosine-5)-methyltransferase 1|nr:DNA (cytosine-5-)-methyltransferase [Christensenellaceae bacterium]
MDKIVKYIDLFAGLGGIRIGLEQSLKKVGLPGECVFTSEIKPHAIGVYQKNFPDDEVHGDITEVDPKNIPDFDILLAGFPCQPFSSAGSRKGFMDTRGTLFFNIEEILKVKKPKAFLLENVEGLVTHDRVDKTKPIGRTLETILEHLEALGYEVSWRLIDASKFGVPQKRKRIYITGSLTDKISLDNIPETCSKLGDILEATPTSPTCLTSKLAQNLLKKYSEKELVGKQIKDKRSGKNNIHSWDVELKGAVSESQKQLLEAVLRQRRRKDWAVIKNIKWSDGMPLTLEDITSFTLRPLSPDFNQELEQLKSDLADLVDKGYLTFETPKQAVDREDLRGYNIVAGKLSFDISNILDPNESAPTLVAMDVTKMAILQNGKFRRLTTREGLRLFGFPENYDISPASYKEAFDLLGNSVSVNAIKLVSERIIEAVFTEKNYKTTQLPETKTQDLLFALDTVAASS